MNSEEKNVFQYTDTNSTRAGIAHLNSKFDNLKIAIIGLGGTGSYILDLVSKTPVKEIHIYDDDDFQLHNAFRAPGATPSEKFDEVGGLKKVDYYFSIYSKMHKGIKPHCERITEANIKNLAGFDFVFLSVDSNESRSMITKKMLTINIPFIDVGLGVNTINGKLLGSIRVTVGTNEKNDHLTDRIGSEETGNNEYSTNIQMAELNCLNATLAVIKWKKIVDFYQDLKQEHNVLYFINTNKTLNEDLTI
jgi:molybdopterin/thiamine biosynthesis adenylyltransferase